MRTAFMKGFFFGMVGIAFTAIPAAGVGIPFVLGLSHEIRRAKVNSRALRAGKTPPRKWDEIALAIVSGGAAAVFLTLALVDRI